MLAGKMKLKHFMAIAGVLAVGAMVGLYVSCDGSKETPSPERASTPPPSRPAANPSPDPAPPSPPTPAGDLPSERPVDVAAAKWRGRAIGSDKLKDVTKGEAYKINVYQDAGHATANRLKIDLDRDDKWDEKWTFDGERIKRQVAPNDDESYSQSFEWSGGAWK